MMPWVQVFYFFISIIDGIDFPMTLLRGLKGVGSAYYRICADPKYIQPGGGGWRGGQEGGGSGKGSLGQESQGGEEGGETARGEDQADRLCQPIRGALRSCRRPSRGAPGSEERGAQSGALGGLELRAVSPGKVPSLLLLH